MYECSSGTATYSFRIADGYGNAYDETTLVKSGTAFNLQSTDLSLKMVSTALASEGSPFVSQTFSLYNTATGSSKTLTIPILHDSATNLQDDEIWVRARYLASASHTLATKVTDARADILTTPADQTADGSSTWTTTGMSNPNKQELSVSFTPQLEGVIEFEICLGKPSYTVYCDIWFVRLS